MLECVYQKLKLYSAFNTRLLNKSKFLNNLSLSMILLCSF